MGLLNDDVYQLTNNMWEIHLKLNKAEQGESLDPDLLRDLRAAADYIRHSLWVHKEHPETLSGKSPEQILLSQRLKRASEMLEAALSESQKVTLSGDDLSLLEKIRTLSAKDPGAIGSAR